MLISFTIRAQPSAHTQRVRVISVLHQLDTARKLLSVQSWKSKQDRQQQGISKAPTYRC